MIIVIFAGGSGSRLWPLSTPNFPKHLLDLTGDKSLIQYSYERAREVSENVYIMTDISHSDEVRSQIPNIGEKLLVEPGRKGTASCVLYALSVIAKEFSDNEPVGFMHADHYVRDKQSFKYNFVTASKLSKLTDRIILIGAEPLYPSTAFGYIEKGSIFDEKSYCFNVKAFREKPDLRLAQSYIRSGNYLWNCGYFVGSVSAFTASMKSSSQKLYHEYIKIKDLYGQKSFKEEYLKLESISIDYALIEKVKDLLVIPALFDWIDVGSFTDLQRIFHNDINGNYVKGEKIELADVENSFIHNEEQKPLAVIGLNNVVVINSKNGLLVARKELSQQIGDVSKKFKENSE